MADDGLTSISATAKPAAVTSGLAATFGLAAASWVLAVWALVGVAVYALYRPHGYVAAGSVVIAAGAYELTPPM